MRPNNEPNFYRKHRLAFFGVLWLVCEIIAITLDYYHLF